MRELDFLDGALQPGRIVIYRYRTSALRRAVRDKIKALFAARGARLVRSSPSHFVQQIDRSGSLFDFADEIPFLDLGTKPSDTKGQEWAEFWGTVRDAQDLVGRAHIRSSTAKPGVLFIEDDVAAKLIWPTHRDDAEVTLIQSMRRVARADIARLVDVLASANNAVLTAPTRDEVIAGAREFWWETDEIGAFTDEIDTLLVAATAASMGAHGAVYRCTRKQQDALSSTLRRFVARGDTAWELISELSKVRRGAEILARLLSATARLVHMSARSNWADGTGVFTPREKLALWIVVMLRHAEALEQASGGPSLWPSADRRLVVLWSMLEEFRTAIEGSVLENDRMMSILRVEKGAAAARRVSAQLSDRLGQRGSALLGERLSPLGVAFWTILKAGLSGLAALEPTPRVPDSAASPRLNDLDDLIGRDGAKHVFLSGLADRWFEKPLLLVGEDGVGKRVIADLFGRLFGCRTATSQHPVVCGTCLVCAAEEFGTEVMDTAAAASDRVKRFIEAASVNNRTITGAPAVRILYNVDGVSRDAVDSVLKSIEEARGTALLLFTARREDAVAGALRSRCFTVPILRLRRHEAEAFARQQLRRVGRPDDTSTVEQVVTRADGLPSRIMDELMLTVQDKSIS